MGFVENNTVPMNLMQSRFFFDDQAFPFESVLLLAEATENNVK